MTLVDSSDDLADDDPSGPHDDDGGDDDGGDPGPGAGGLSWPRVAALVAAVAWLAGATVWYLERDPAPSVGSVDAGFALDMITHHDQAVELALLELENGEDPVVRGFAQEVILFQRYEIGRLDEQLGQWGLSVADRNATAMAWMDMPVPVAEMPGMASSDQIAQLRDARGAEADALFLDILAEHHRGGVHMASYAADNASSSRIRDIAATMVANQSVEIDEYGATAERLGLDVQIDPYDADTDPFADDG